ncbi:hypothetical protein GCM10023310_68660 [Paenibacillus vulneris]|uniref:Uncharacterized protein n=1 Tax=Paenibacillus vulneris TaxID=1133364 RepID=A0ABW3UG66_9BACL
MTSIDILKLHSYFLDKFKINQISLCALDLFREILKNMKIEEFFEYIEKNEIHIDELINKYKEDERLISYAIIRLVYTS